MVAYAIIQTMISVARKVHVPGSYVPGYAEQRTKRDVNRINDNIYVVKALNIYNIYVVK